jgi:hypothetical protein
VEGFRSKLGAAVPQSRLGAFARNDAIAAPVAAAGLVLGALLVRVWLSRKIAAPWIMVDELVYSELAKSFAEHGRFLIRDQPTALYSLVYPVLLAPAWLADTMATTYTLAKSINGVVMALAAVPVYLWARRLVAPWSAVAVTALVLLLPFFVYTGMLMTENAFFPTALLAFWAAARAIERPTIAAQALALGAIALTCAVRLQALVLLLIYPSAVLLGAFLDRRAGERRSLRPYAFTLGLLGTGVLGFVALNLAQGHSLLRGLGAYRAAGEAGYSVGAVAKWALYHAGGVVVSSAVVGAAALALLVTLAASGRLGASRAERAFLAVSTCAVVWFVIQVGAFASSNSFRIQERAYTSVVPLLLIAVALWIDRGLPRPPRATAAVLAVCVGLVAVLPLHDLLTYTILSDSFSLLSVSRLNGLLPGGTTVLRAVVAAGALAAALVFALVPRRAARPVVFGGLAALLAVSSVIVFLTVRDQSVRVRYVQGVGNDVSWVDRALGRDADVAYLYTGKLDFVIMWQVEFWNRSIGEVVNLGAREPGALPERHTFIDFTTGQLLDAESREPVRSDGIVSDSTVTFTGRLAQRWPSGLEAYDVAPEPRVKEIFEGLYPDGWAGATLDYTLLGCPGGRLAFRLETDPRLLTEPQRVTFRSRGKLIGRATIPPGTPTVVDVEPVPEENRCAVHLDVATVAVPAEVLPGSFDTRRLGVIVRGVAYERP